ncbi:MAG TPA: biotin transporter BioY [Solirubrobacteraceae bacterium]|nr:biotin transporter BioY [Solirubrobacteraceae bacterium]
MSTFAYASSRSRRSLVLADLIPGTLVRDVLLVVGSAGFVGLLAQVVIHLPWTPVPMTGQTLGVLVAGTALGWRRGGIALALYLLAGLAGVPWFSSGASGYVGASFGYIIAFVFSAAVCGRLAELGQDRSILRSIPAMVVGSLVTYAIGTAWLAVYLHVGVGKAIDLGIRPFIWGDVIKAAIAAGLLPAAWKLAGRR